MNPFTEIGLPPDGSNPRAQLDWLERMINALESAQEPRLGPLKKRVKKIVLDYQRNAALGKSPQEIGDHVHRQIRALQIEVFTVLVRLMQQIRAGVHVKLAKQQPDAPLDPRAEALLAKIDELSEKLRRLVNAMKKNDAATEAAVRAELATVHSPADDSDDREKQ